MKRYLKLLIILLGVMFISTTVLADEEAKPYEYFDFKVEKVDGANIKSTNIRVFASIEGEEANLIDRTSEFDFVEVMWSVCEDVDCATSREVDDDAIFEADKDYVLVVRINAKNGAAIDVWGTDKAKYNGTPIDLLAGEFGNTGTELMIKTRTDVHTSEPIEDTKVEEPTSVTTQPVTTVGATTGKTCMFNIELCCNESLGISICIWILIIVGLLLLVIVSKLFKGKKKEKKPVTPVEGAAADGSHIISNDETSILNVEPPVTEIPEEVTEPQVTEVQTIEETPEVVEVPEEEKLVVEEPQSTNNVNNTNNTLQ